MTRPVFFLISALTVCSAPINAEEQTGRLVFELKPYTSDFELRRAEAREGEELGLEWGFLPEQPNQLLVSGIPYVNWHVPNLKNRSSYCTQQQVELRSGDYALSCLWITPSVGFTAGGLLRKSAFVNVDVLHFTIKAGDTTVLEARTQLHKTNVALQKIIFRDIVVTVVDHGSSVAAAAINARTEKSVPWADYAGPLKLP